MDDPPPKAKYGPLPKLHPRTQVVETARNDVGSAVLRALDQHDLTPAETISVVTQAMTSLVSSVARHMIRIERHGDPDKEGDIDHDS